MSDQAVAVLGPSAMALIIAALMTSLCVPIIKRVAMAFRAVDYPGGRREHGKAIPRLGGVAVIGGVVFGVTTVALIQWPVHGGVVGRSVLFAWALGTSMVFLVGLIEDLIGVSAIKRLFVEVAAAWIVVSIGWKFTVFSLPIIGPVQLGWMGTVITIVWIVGVTNAVNLLDGLDGLATGVIAIIAGSLAVIAGFKGNFFSAVLLAGIVGACLGFLRHNWTPATIFLGDAGSLTLGFILASLTVHGSLKSSAAVAILVPILALGVPVIDTLLVMLLRFIDRSQAGVVGRLSGMFLPDRRHLHHLLQYLGPRRATVVRWIYVLVLVSCGGALAVALTKSSPLGLVLVGVELVVIFLVRRLGLAKRAGTLGSALRKEAREEFFSEADGAKEGVS
jgi:UDP-GlcNAc:undecaprenyl-phosphate GlcNAc-1-phosphate transferase